MLDHHIQRRIVYTLALARRLRFSELKPDDLENKLFTYHLKKTVSAGYVLKSPEGFYELTPEGRRLGVHVLENVNALFDRAYSVLFMVVKSKDTAKWLLYRRKSHPLFGKVGFMHATPNASELIVATAQSTLQEKTGLTGTFHALGGGFFRVYEGEVLESFTNFTLLVCEDASGTLKAGDEFADYFWVDNLDPEDDDLLPNMAALTKKYLQNELFFLDETLQATAA